MLSNWTKATTTTTGTGTLTLSAVSGRPLPSAAHVVGEYVQYSLNTSDGKFEAGIGKIASGNTFERSVISSTYDGTTYNQLTATALSLAAGTHTLYVTPIAAVLQSSAKFAFTNSTASYSSNRYVASLHLGSGTTGTNLYYAQQAIAWPFILSTAGLATGIQVKVSTAQTGATVLVGIYEQATDGMPGRLLGETSSAIDASSTGIKTQTLTSNIRLSPGFYWIAVLQPQSGSVVSLEGATSISYTPIGGVSTPRMLTNVRCSTTATTLSDPFSTSSLVCGDANGGVNSPVLGIVFS